MRMTGLHLTRFGTFRGQLHGAIWDRHAQRIGTCFERCLSTMTPSSSCANP